MSRQTELLIVSVRFSSHTNSSEQIDLVMKNSVFTGMAINTQIIYRNGQTQ